jgi:hypothetical protein
VLPTPKVSAKKTSKTMSRIFNVENYGAIGNGVSDCTAAIQQAIDACADAGGGTVLIKSGTYLFYPLRLRSNVRLEIAWDAVMLAGTDPSRYPEIEENRYWKVGFSLRNNRRCVFYGEGVSHVAICGEGKIDFQGQSFANVDWEMKEFFGHWKRKHNQLVPGRSIFFVGSRDIRLEGLTLVDSAGWFTWFLDCENIRVENVTMHADLRMPNTDGIHFGSCRDAVVNNCNLHTGDDCIVIRSMQEQFDEPKPCENIVVTNCILQSSTVAVRIGWTHDYLMRNCTFSNLVIKRSSRAVAVTSPALRGPDGDPPQTDPPRYPNTPKPYPEIKPFTVENFLFSNIEAETVRAFFQIVLADSEKVDHVRNIAFRGVHAVSGVYPTISASSEHDVSDIEFTDFTLEMRYNPELEGLYETLGRGMNLDVARNVIFNNFRISRTL